MSRASFHRIVKSFILIENELYRQEQKHAPSPDRLSSGRLSPVTEVASRLEVTRDNSLHTWLEDDSLAEGIVNMYRDDHCVSDATHLHSDHFLFNDNATITSDFAQPGRATMARLGSEARASESTVSVVPPSYQRRNHHLRASDGTFASGGTAGTEGTVANAVFMPEAMHGETGVRGVNNWYLPFWQRYRPWHVLTCGVFLLGLLTVAVLVAVVLHLTHQRGRREGDLLVQELNKSRIIGDEDVPDNSRVPVPLIVASREFRRSVRDGRESKDEAGCGDDDDDNDDGERCDLWL